MMWIFEKSEVDFFKGATVYDVLRFSQKKNNNAQSHEIYSAAGSVRRNVSGEFSSAAESSKIG